MMRRRGLAVGCRETCLMLTSLSEMEMLTEDKVFILPRSSDVRAGPAVKMWVVPQLFFLIDVGEPSLDVVVSSGESVIAYFYRLMKLFILSFVITVGFCWNSCTKLRYWLSFW